MQHISAIGKSVLIAGASRGLGAALAMTFAPWCSKLVLTCSEGQEYNMNSVAEACWALGNIPGKAFEIDLRLTLDRPTDISHIKGIDYPIDIVVCHSESLAHALAPHPNRQLNNMALKAEAKGLGHRLYWVAHSMAQGQGGHIFFVVGDEEPVSKLMVKTYASVNCVVRALNHESERDKVKLTKIFANQLPRDEALFVPNTLGLVGSSNGSSSLFEDMTKASTTHDRQRNPDLKDLLPLMIGKLSAQVRSRVERDIQARQRRAVERARAESWHDLPKPLYVYSLSL